MPSWFRGKWGRFEDDWLVSKRVPPFPLNHDYGRKGITSYMNKRCTEVRFEAP